MLGLGITSIKVELGVFAVGLPPDFVQSMVARLPDSLVNLAPVLKMTWWLWQSTILQPDTTVES